MCHIRVTIINSAYVMRKIFRKSEINAVIEWLCESFNVSSISRVNIMDAVQKDSYDFEDTVQYYSALSYHPDVILTRDKKGFSDLDIPVMTLRSFGAEQTAIEKVVSLRVRKIDKKK